MNMFQSMVVWLLFVAALFCLAGCDTEDGDCPVEDRYINGYQEVAFPSGEVYLQPLWVCP